MASPLTLIMPLIPGTTLDEIIRVVAKYTPDISKAVKNIGTVHYARVMVFDRSTPNLQPGMTPGSLSLAIITEYDGDFNAYIQDFVVALGEAFFDALLPLVVGGKALLPTIDHIPEFEKYVMINDASAHPPNSLQENNGLYEAYPYTVQTILASCG